ncbi:TPM domain-containing protein [Isoptericola sp. b490]|uniref:TPM domain-containing protein n=1 Tax=Actinotalea lenta TaxID=3064654 RepID=UPI0027132319|nr:TPM domain-containing protein [Isoptericola sp. b490]MDO8121633.1 TPM domain-containing protein [Isoptericola sp. b490]
MIDVTVRRRGGWPVGHRSAVAVLLGVVLLGAVVLAGSLALPAAAAPSAAHRVTIDAPGNLAGEVTDTAGVLGSDTARVQGAIDRLQSDTGFQLFVAYVPSFDGTPPADWANATFDASGLGDDDALLAVAVTDRRYYVLVDSTLTDAQVATVRRAVEEHLGKDDWAGAAIAAADGLRDAAGGGTGAAGTTSGSTGLLLAAVLVLLVLAVVVLAARHRRDRQDPARLPTAQLSSRASTALVALDDAVKTSEQELGFAQAQFGVEATRRFAAVLQDAKAALTEGFTLRQQLDDDQPETEPQARAMMTRILELCRAADEQLDAQAEEFDRLRDLQARAPQLLTETAQRADEVASRLGAAHATLDALATTYSAAALTTVTPNADQAAALLDAARESVRRGQAVVDTDRAAAVALARAAEDAVEQAVRLLDAVDRARTDLEQAAAKIDAGLASLGADVADAERLGAQDTTVGAAAGVARRAIAEATAAREGGDRLGALQRLTEAEAALDAALAPARAEAERLERMRTQLADALDRVSAQVRSVGAFIETRRGAVGAAARTRLAEASRTAQEAERTSATDPGAALDLVRRAASLAAEAEQLAEADVRRWQAGRQGPSGATSLVLGGILLDQMMRGGRGGYGRRGAFGGFGGFGGGRGPGSFGGGGTRARRGGGGRF